MTPATFRLICDVFSTHRSGYTRYSLTSHCHLWVIPMSPLWLVRHTHPKMRFRIMGQRWCTFYRRNNEMGWDEAPSQSRLYGDRDAADQDLMQFLLRYT